MTLRDEKSGGWKRTNPESLKGDPAKKELELFLKLEKMIDFMKKTRTLASIRRKAVLLKIIKNFPPGFDHAPNDELHRAFRRVVHNTKIGQTLFEQIELHPDGEKYLYKLKKDITRDKFINVVKEYLENHSVEGNLLDFAN